MDSIESILVISPPLWKKRLLLVVSQFWGRHPTYSPVIAIETPNRGPRICAIERDHATGLSSLVLVVETFGRFPTLGSPSGA